MPKLVGTGLNQVPMNSMLGSMAFQDITSYFRAVQGTAQATTSGTAIDFTGIPSWVKRITVMFNGVSTNLTSDHLIKIGSGSIVSTGYATSVCRSGAAANFYTVSTSGTGWQITRDTTNSELFYGHALITSLGSNTWIVSGTNLSAVNSNNGHIFSGSLTLSGTLDRIRLTTVNGTDTFDAGSVNILYEG